MSWQQKSYSPNCYRKTCAHLPPHPSHGISKTSTSRSNQEMMSRRRRTPKRAWYDESIRHLARRAWRHRKSIPYWPAWALKTKQRYLPSSGTNLSRYEQAAATRALWRAGSTSTPSGQQQTSQQLKPQQRSAQLLEVLRLITASQIQSDCESSDLDTDSNESLQPQPQQPLPANPSSTFTSGGIKYPLHPVQPQLPRAQTPTRRPQLP